MTEEVKVSFAPSSDPVADNGTAPAQAPAVDFGIPGVTARPGDHICALYRREKERDEGATPADAGGSGADAAPDPPQET